MLTRSIMVLLLSGLAVCVAGAADTTRATRLNDWRDRLERARGGGDSDRAADLYRSILDEAAALGEDGILVARASDGLADLYRERHRFDLAVPLYERAADLWGGLLGANQPRLALTRHNLGVCYIESRRWDDAERVLREALATWRARGDEAHAAESDKALRAALEKRTLPWDRAGTTAPR